MSEGGVVPYYPTTSNQKVHLTTNNTYNINSLAPTTAVAKFNTAVKAGKGTDTFYTVHKTSAALLSSSPFSASNLIGTKSASQSLSE